MQVFIGSLPICFLLFPLKLFDINQIVMYFNKYSIQCCISIFFILILHINNYAQDTEKILDSVIIRVGKPKHPLLTTSPVQTLSGEKLQQLNSFSVADALRYFSGVQIKDYGGIGGLKTINVRNMGSHHVAMVLDGVRIVNAQNGTVDLGKYSLDNVEMIQLFNGGNFENLQPAVNQLASSAIYIQTKRPFFSSTKNYQLKTGIKAGSFGLLNPSFTWHQKINSTISTSTNIEFLTAHGKYHYRYTNGYYDTIGTRKNGDITGLRIENYSIKKLKDNGELFFKIYYYHSNRGLPGAIVANKFYNSQRLTDKNFFIQGSLRKKINKPYSLLLNSKYSYDYTRYIDPEFIMSSGPLKNNYHLHEFYFSVSQELKINNWWKWSLATDFSQQKMDADLYLFAFPKRSSFVGAINSSIKFPNFIMNAGWTAVYHHETTKNTNPSKDKSAITPSVSASWQPFNKFPIHIRSFYKASLRMPSFNDLYFTQVGNIFLKPEFTKQINLGFLGASSFGNPTFYSSLQVDAYYNKVNNKIVAVPSANLFRWMMLNIGAVAIKGLDLNLEISKKFKHSFSTTTGIKYSRQSALNKTKGQSSYNHQIPYTPLNNGSITISSQWKNWSLNFSFIYTGERYALPENIAINHIQPWYTSDISLQKKIIKKNNNIKLLIEVNNILNQYYDVVINFPMPGRHIRSTISLEL
ncbi:MAG: TonB-dependent receptor [Chitinophagaceae bacterium]|nr:MAG: TonB-dependent receptor [Chitinophagaceae bacterium]